MGAAWVALILSSLGFSALFSACKPTERGYKNAYDAAVNKRAEAVREQMLPATGCLATTDRRCASSTATRFS